MGHSKLWRKGAERSEIDLALSLLPFQMPEHGSTGESFAERSGTAFKRVLTHRVAEWMRPSSYLETHAGRNVATNYVLFSCPACEVVACRDWEAEVAVLKGRSFDLIDVDPFGCPLDALRATRRLQGTNCVVFATSGTIYRRFRGWDDSGSGLAAREWAEGDHLREVEAACGLTCRFMYVHPNMSRFVLCANELPAALFEQVPRRLGCFR